MTHQIKPGYPASELKLSFQHSDTSRSFAIQLNVHFNRCFLFFGHLSPSAYALQLCRHISRQPNDTILIYSVERKNIHKLEAQS